MRRLRRRAALPMLVTFGLIEAVCLALVAVVMVADPYDVYGWGVRPEVKAGDVPGDPVVDWINVAANDPGITRFLVGSSITAMYDPDDITALLGDKTVGYNLSYGGPRPRDRDIVLDRLATSSHVQHIIVTFDWIHILDPKTIREGFPEFLYDDEFTNDLRMVSLTALRRLYEIFHGDRTYDNPGDAKRYAEFVEREYRHFQQPDTMTELQSLIDGFRPIIDAPSGRTCADLDAIDEQLVPRVLSLAEKGIKVDILVPILSYASYYHRMSEISPTLLDEEMIARRCLVEAVGDRPNVRVFAFDDDPSVAGDLGNFRDVAHVYNPALLRKFISSIATGDGLLTRSNIEDYERTIRAAVKNYQVSNSYLYD